MSASPRITPRGIAGPVPVSGPSPTANPRVVCVLGMHRSGTSLITRMLNVLGVYLGPDERLMKPHVEDNPRGYWEHQFITDLNDAILARLGGSWHEPPTFFPGWESAPELADLRQKARAVLREDFATAVCWGWKDPRTCLTLPFWQRLAPPIRYVLCLRNPVDVAHSLHRRGGFSAEKSARLWLTYVASALALTAGQPRRLVFYEDAMRNWQAELRRLARFADAPELAERDATQSAVREFLEEELQHHRTSVIDAADDGTLPFPAKSVYVALRLYAELDRDGVSDGLVSEAMLGDCVDRLGLYAVTAQSEREGHERRIRDLREELGGSRQELSGALEAVKRGQEESRGLRAEAAELRQKLSGALAAVKRGQEESRGLRAEAAELRQELSSALEAVKRGEEESRGLRAEMAELRRELSGALEAVKRGEEESRGLRAEAVELRQELSQIKTLVEQNRAETVLKDSRIKALEEQNLRMFRSWSWRLTRPLRITPAKLWQWLRQMRAARLVRRSHLWRWLYLMRAARLVRRSHLFDPKFYLECNPDVAAVGVDPVWHYLLWGASEGRDPHPDFDTSFYLESNADVARAGVNPLVHYLVHGKAEGRKTRESQQSSDGTRTLPVSTRGDGHLASAVNVAALPHPAARVVYVSGWPGSTSHVYRVDHHVQALRASGVVADWFPIQEITRHQSAIVLADVVVLFRVAWSDEVATVVERARRAGTRIVYDTDDYVFDPTVANETYVDGIRFLSEGEIDHYHEGVLRYREALLNADECIFSTRFLTEQAARLGRPAHHLFNGFDEDKLRVSETARRARARWSARREPFRIGYSSGTLTHQKDFAAVVPALARLLRERPDVVLTIVGLLKLDEFPDLLPFAQRIEQRPLASFADVPHELAHFHVNLAPLEIGNPFCEAKSELKYYEAALVGVPTVASGTQTFRDAIRHGETGFVATTSEDWYRYLSVLLADGQLYERMASVARAHALATYGPQAKQEAALRLFLAITDRAGRAVAARGRTATFVLPGMERGSGGHRNILMLARGLARHGYRVILTFTGATSSYPTPESLADEFRLYEDSIWVFYSEQPVQRSDITFATFWTTVYSIRDCPLDLGVKFHFVQDYEALFYPMGTDHVGALNALHQGFRLVTWGPWTRELLLARHGLDAAVIPIPIDHGIYRVRDEIERRKDLVTFFARPEMPRRCFELGVRALEIFQKTYGKDFEIAVFGSNRVPADLPFRFRDLGVLRRGELAELYSTATVGLAFSPTNPSSVPYEMMSCGLPVIDLDLPGNAQNYGSRDNVVLVKPDEREIANALFRTLSDEGFRADVARKGAAFAESFPSEEDTIDMFFKIVEQEVGDRAGARTPPRSAEVGSERLSQGFPTDERSPTR